MNTKKFYLASTGKEIKMGDTIKGTYCKDGVTVETLITVSDATVPILKNMGIIDICTITRNTIPTITAVIERIASRLGWNTRKVKDVLSSISEIMPMAAFNILLREVALMLDEKYPDHISKSEEIYCISSLNGVIYKVEKPYIKSYKNFAAFRTIEDAKLACKILKVSLRVMFNSGK